VALSALMIVVVVLSAVNLFHYSTRLKEWLGAGTARSPSLPIGQGSATAADIAAPKPPPSPPLDTPAAPAAVTPADTPLVKEKTRTAAKNAVADRPATSGATPAAPAPCRDVVAALGLCNANITVKNK
jgi:hypothetical protein